MSRKETIDLSFVADRVLPQTWTLFQSLRSRMRQLRGVTVKVNYEKNSGEAMFAYQYENRLLFHLHARGEEINATFHADQRARDRIVEDQSLDWRLRDQVSRRTRPAFTLRTSKDLGPFMELVKAKYEHINQEATGLQTEIRPVAF
jgi:hypothetical protein